MRRPWLSCPRSTALLFVVILALGGSACEDAPPSTELSEPPTVDAVPGAGAFATREARVARRATRSADYAATATQRAAPTVARWPTQGAWPLPTPTPSPTSGLSYTATPGPTWTPDLEPLHVRVSLDSIVATEEARFGIEELEGRVDRTYYVRAEDLVRTVRERQPRLLYDLDQQGYPIFLESGEPLPLTESGERPRGYAVVEVSHAEIYDSGFPQREEIPAKDASETVIGPERVAWAMLYDAERPVQRVYDGARVVWDDAIGAELSAMSPAMIDETNLPVETSTPTPSSPRRELTLDRLSRSPDIALADRTPQALATGEVPRALVDSATELGLVPGARWRYREIHSAADRVVSSGQVDVEVAYALRLARDVMELRLLASPSGSSFRWKAEGRIRYVLPGGAIGGGDGDGVKWHVPAEERQELLRRPSQDSAELACAWLAPVSSGPWLDARPEDCATSIHRAQTVITPAGTFHGCARHEYILGAAKFSVVWRCPSVGVVRVLTSGLQSMKSFWHSWDLVDYEIPLLVPVP